MTRSQSLSAPDPTLRFSAIRTHLHILASNNFAEAFAICAPDVYADGICSAIYATLSPNQKVGGLSGKNIRRQYSPMLLAIVVDVIFRAVEKRGRSGRLVAH